MKNFMKRLRTFGSLCLLACASSIYASNNYGLPSTIQEGNILHCFDWTFSQIEQELPNIAEAGFVAVQVSPVQGNCSSNAEWFYAYMPYDLVFRSNGNGSKTQLTSLCSKAKEYGIKIIVDVVANHVNKASGYHDTWWDSNGRVRWNGGIDYSNRYSITHGQLGDYGDINSEDSEVQARAKSFVEDLKSCGVEGIRWDAAKHIGLPSESCNFWSQVCSVAGLWHYGEILDGPGGDKYTLLKEYCNYMSVTDSEYSTWARNEVCNGNVPSSYGSWSANGVPATGIVYWGESHDTYANDNGASTYVSQDKIDRAWALGACRNGETSLYLSRPSATGQNNIKIGVKGSTHFTSKEIAAVNHLKNAAVGCKDYYSASDGIACITREGVGACIVIGAGGSRSVTVANGGSYVPAGTYTDEVSGNTFTVTSSTISGQVGSTGIAVIYGSVKKQPSMTFSPNGGSFRSETLSVTATLNNASSGWYKIDNGNQVTFSDSKTFTIGEGVDYGSQIVVSWSATGDEGTKTGSVTFKKVEASNLGDNVIYYDNTSSNWSTPKCHYWGGSEESTWPGATMTLLEDNVWYYDCPAGTTGLVFNDGNGNQTTDFTFTAGHIYSMSGDQGDYEGGNGSGNQGGGNQGGDITDMPDAFYVMGEVNGQSWDPAQGAAMTKSGNTFVYSGTIEGYFSFASALGSAGDWSGFNAAGVRYGASTDTTLDLDATATIAQNNDPKAYTLATIETGTTYYITVDWAAKTVKVSKDSGVDALEFELSSPCTYYNLQGMKVEHPTTGIYIVHQGNKTYKRVIR
jgi:alpha-amylase